MLHDAFLEKSSLRKKPLVPLKLRGIVEVILLYPLYSRTHFANFSHKLTLPPHERQDILFAFWFYGTFINKFQKISYWNVACSGSLFHRPIFLMHLGYYWHIAKCNLPILLWALPAESILPESGTNIMSHCRRIQLQKSVAIPLLRSLSTLDQFHICLYVSAVSSKQRNKFYPLRVLIGKLSENLKCRLES